MFAFFRILRVFSLKSFIKSYIPPAIVFYSHAKTSLKGKDFKNARRFILQLFLNFIIVLNSCIEYYCIESLY